MKAFFFVLSISFFAATAEAKVSRKPNNVTEEASVLNCSVQKEQRKTSYSVRSGSADSADYDSPGYRISFFHYGTGFMMETYDKSTTAEMSTQISPNSDGLFFMDLKTRGLRDGTEILRVECRIQR